MQMRMLRSAWCALLVALCAIWSLGALAATAQTVESYAGTYTGTGTRNGGSVAFNFVIDERGSIRGKLPAPGGKQLDLLGGLFIDGANARITLAAQDFGGTNYAASVSGILVRTSTGTVTGSGPFVDNISTSVGSWTGRRTAVPVVKRSITGRVVNSQGVGVPNVVVRCTGTTAVATTNGLGSYTFNDLVPGRYVITASRADLTFVAATATATITSANVTAPNITALFKITGQVVLPNNTGVANVRITRSGSTVPVLTNARGEFTFTNVPSGAVVLTPSRTGLVIAPTAFRGSITTNNLTNVRFTTSYSITGRVVNATGTGIAGVTMTRTGDGRTVTTTTNATGNYSFTGLGTGSFFVTPTRTGLTFAPFTQRANLTTGSIVVPNFRAGFTLTGRITNSAGAGIPNVRVSRTGSTVAVLTNSAGTYTFTDVQSGTVIVTPALAGFTFAPVSRTLAVSVLPVTVQAFIATPVGGRVGKFSLSNASVNGDQIALQFIDRLNADSAADAANYKALVNGQPVDLECISVLNNNSIVVLGLPAGTLQAGDNVTVEWNGLSDVTGSALSGATNLTR